MKTPLILLATVQLVAVNALFAQGPLTPPPGPPAPDMKTLQQIEPRIDLRNAPSTAVTTTDPAWHFIVNQAGSYYLSGNLAATKTNGIRIAAKGVTLDLNGFQISKAAGGGTGIEVSATSHDAAVHSGAIDGFAYGVRSIIFGSYARGCSFRDLAVSACTTAGIVAGEGAVLENCRVRDGSGTYGIYAHISATLSNCVVARNSADHGIYVRDGVAVDNCTVIGDTGSVAGIYGEDGVTLRHCTVRLSNTTSGRGIFLGKGAVLRGCTVSDNTVQRGIQTGPGATIVDCAVSDNAVVQHGIDAGAGSLLQNCTAADNIGSSFSGSFGIIAGPGSTVTACTARNNTSSAGLATPDTGTGFGLGGGSTISNCTATRNQGNGISIAESSVALNNNSHENGWNGDGAGIRASGRTRIEGNSANDNTRGIDVWGTNNLIIKNRAGGNGVNYVIANGNAALVVTATTSGPINGSTGGSSPGSTNPWANFAF